MRAQDTNTTPGRFLPVIENTGAASPVILVCEHASNALPAPWGDLGLSPDQTRAHIAWDPGALGLARGLAARLDATLIHAPVSRLIYDCNRAPDMPGAMPARSEVHDIPGNAAIPPAERLARTEAIYLPWANGLHNLIATRIAQGRRPVIVTIHSFTPVFHGKPRAVEFGIIHDADPALALAIHAASRASGRRGCSAWRRAISASSPRSPRVCRWWWNPSPGGMATRCWSIPTSILPSRRRSRSGA